MDGWLLSILVSPSEHGGSSLWREKHLEVRGVIRAAWRRSRYQSRTGRYYQTARRAYPQLSSARPHGERLGGRQRAVKGLARHPRKLSGPWGGVAHQFTDSKEIFDRCPQSAGYRISRRPGRGEGWRAPADALFKARVGFGWLTAHLIGGIIDCAAFASIIGNLKASLDARAAAARSARLPDQGKGNRDNHTGSGLAEGLGPVRCGLDFYHAALLMLRSGRCGHRQRARFSRG